MNPRARELRFRRIKEIGCIACLRHFLETPCEIHHLNTGGHAGHKRRGDEYTIGLCTYHHRGVGSMPGGNKGPSLALKPNSFRAFYGTDDQMLEEQNGLIADAEARASGWRTDEVR